MKLPGHGCRIFSEEYYEMVITVKVEKPEKYKLLNKSKEEQRHARDALLTEKILLQQAREEDIPNAFGKKEKNAAKFQPIKTIRGAMPYIFGLIVLAAVFAGYRLKEFQYFTAEDGVGYALGIIGGSLMLALLLYPLRKRYRIFRLIGNVRAWFGLHMVFGILGPLLILFHANFSLGSTNSSIALFSMLIVSASGVIGRYIYTKIHYGLYGQKIELAQLKDHLHHNQEELTALMHLNPEARTELFDFADHVLTPPGGLLHSWERVLSVGIRSRFLVRKIKQQVYQDLKQKNAGQDYSRKDIRRKVRLIVRESRQFLQQARKLVEFNFYERMFALWHVLHLPLFFMLVIAAIVHIIAVHWY